MLPVNGVAICRYDYTSSRWRVISHTRLNVANIGSALIPSALPSGDTNNWNPTGFANHTLIKVTPDAAGSTLTGMAAGRDGEVKTLQVMWSTGGSLTLAEYRTSSSANLLVCPNLVDLVIRKGGCVHLRYDITEQVWMVTGGAP